MSFKESLDTIRLKNLEFTKCLKANKSTKSKLNEQQISEIIESLRLIIENVSFQRELNANLDTLAENGDDIQIFHVLIKNSLKYILLNPTNNVIENCFCIIESISILKCMQFILIKSSVLVKLLKLEPFIDVKRLLQVILSLSENNFNDKIILNKNENVTLFDTLNLIDKKYPNQIIIHEIVANLRQNSFEKCLISFNEIVLNEKQMKNIQFLKDLRFISNLLNGKTSINSEFIDMNKFCQYNTFEFFMRLLRFLLNKLFDRDNERLRDELVLVLNDLLNITSRIMERKWLYHGNFLREGIFEVCVDFVYERNYTVVQLLFNEYPHVLDKLMRTFLRMCQFIYYNRPNMSIDEMRTFRILRKSRDILGELSLFKDFLESLAYLEESRLFVPFDSPLLKPIHYELIASSYNILHLFNKVSNEYKQESILIECDIVNEWSQIERQRVSKFNFVDLVLVNLIESIRVIYSTCDDTMKLAFNLFKCLFKSLVFFGLDIEKILCLNCLIKWILVDSIRNEISDDRQFYAYLESLLEETLQTNGDVIKSRLNKVLNEFFMLV